jgi:hypothetical protein
MGGADRSGGTDQPPRPRRDRPDPAGRAGGAHLGARGELGDGLVHPPQPEGSRFSDGRYGVYYAALELQTAIRETAHHFALFAADSGDGSRYEDMRVLAGRIDADFHDIASLPPDPRRAILDPDDYAAGRALRAQLREAGSNGVVYPSVRHAGGECIGAFRPKSVHPPSEERHVRYHYDGIRVRRWFDYGSGAWTAL